MTIFIWLAIIALVLLVLAGIYFALRKTVKTDEPGLDDSSTIYTSGVYSLIRKSPREELFAKEPSPDLVEDLLQASSEADESLNEYIEEWRRVANLSITNVERGDQDGVQTYRYRVPPKCRSVCHMFDGDAYVTREQLHKHVELIPPFHLGCGCELITKEAWSAESGSAGWAPILPVDGKYRTPDWRTVVKLNV